VTFPGLAVDLCCKKSIVGLLEAIREGLVLTAEFGAAQPRE
jgi:hypothetical protein